MSGLLFEIQDSVARFTINRPDAMNAMPAAMWAELADRLHQIEYNPEVRVVLLQGAGDNFCAGGDIKEFATTLDMSKAERAAKWSTTADTNNVLFLILERMPQPFVVSVRGMAAGGGMGLVAAADLAIISDTSQFFVAQIKLGAIPDSVTSYNMLRCLGMKATKQYCLLGDPIDAQTALDVGLVNWIVPDVELEERTEKLLKRLVAMSPVAMGRTKAAINAAHHTSLAEHVIHESIDVGACVQTDEFVNSVRAFTERSRK